MSAGKILLIVFGVFVAFIGLVALWGVGSYNGLVSGKQAVNQQWAQVQNVYQRRADLIPNLVQTVAGAANFEKSTLIAVTDARASVGRVQLPAGAAPTDPSQLAAFDQAQGQLGSALSRLLVVSRKVSRSHGHGQLPGPAGAARGDGESHRGRARPLQ